MDQAWLLVASILMTDDCLEFLRQGFYRLPILNAILATASFALPSRGATQLGPKGGFSSAKGSLLGLGVWGLVVVVLLPLHSFWFSHVFSFLSMERLSFWIMPPAAVQGLQLSMEVVYLIIGEYIWMIGKCQPNGG